MSQSKKLISRDKITVSIEKADININEIRNVTLSESWPSGSKATASRFILASQKSKP